MAVFVTLPRIMDNGVMCFKPSDVTMVGDFNDQHGNPVPGTCSIYLNEGSIGFSVNKTTEEVMDILRNYADAEITYFHLADGEIN